MVHEEVRSIQEGTTCSGVFRLLREGSGGCGRVQEGPGGFTMFRRSGALRRSEERSGTFERDCNRSGGFKKVHGRARGFSRVQVSLGSFMREKELSGVIVKVQVGVMTVPEGSGWFGRDPESFPEGAKRSKGFLEVQ